MVKGYPAPVAVLAEMEEVEPLTPMTPLARVQWTTPIVLDTVEVTSRAYKSELERLQQFDARVRLQRGEKKQENKMFTLYDYGPEQNEIEPTAEDRKELRWSPVEWTTVSDVNESKERVTEVQSAHRSEIH